MSSPAPPALSVVVVAYDMGRELPRTIRSLVPPYQRGVRPDELELLVVDNGSPDPVLAEHLAPGEVDLRTLRLDPAPPSPARAANKGIAEARGELVGLIVDGARMASPGLLALARQAARLGPRTVVATLAFHLGTQTHMEATTTGWDQRAEDALLAGLAWEDDGYRLFAASTLAGSSGRGWFGPLGECSALFLPRPLWDELGGLDEAFALPGGGLVNHDLYHRACHLPDVQLVVLLGEATFHQHHGGAATSGRFDFDALQDDHERLRGHRYRPPEVTPLYLGHVPPTTLAHLEHSVHLAQRRAARRPRPT